MVVAISNGNRESEEVESEELGKTKSKQEGQILYVERAQRRVAGERLRKRVRGLNN
jgi:hypothetical protein